jgi:GNAT superfamily N-acetyltransferase
LNRSAHCYVGVLEGVETRRVGQDRFKRAPAHHERFSIREDGGPSVASSLVPPYAHPVAFCAVLSAIGYRGVWRVSRLVVLPDYQGIGIGRAMLSAVAEQYPRLRITTSHPALLRALSADPAWQLAALRRAGYTRQPNAKSHTNFRGGAIGGSSAGRCVATFEKNQTEKQGTEK